MCIFFCTFARKSRSSEQGKIKRKKLCNELMPKLSVIILSYAIDEEVYQMNCRAIESLYASENWSDGEPEVLLVESNREATYEYDKRVKVLMPEEKFGFHRFFNIGLDNTSGEFVAFCNNDIVFTPGWWRAIMKVKEQHPKFMCFSPVDSSYPMMAEEIAKGKEYIIGWENKRHFAAWCFVWERKVFKTIGRFDETFDFYSADDDELQTLRYYAIPNVLVTASEVKHLSQVVTNKVGVEQYKVTDKEKYPLSEYEIKRGYAWLWDDVRFYVAYQREKAKWGNHHMRQRVNRLLESHPWMNVRPVTRVLYNRTVNMLLAWVSGSADQRPVKYKEERQMRVLFMTDKLYPSTGANDRIVYRIIDELLKYRNMQISIIGEAPYTEQQKANYKGCLQIYEPYYYWMRYREMSIKLGKWSWLRFILNPRTILYRISKQNEGDGPYRLEMNRWLKKHCREYDAIVAMSMPYLNLEVAATVGDKVPVIFYPLEPIATYNKTCQNFEQLLDYEIAIENAASKIILTSLIHEDFLKERTRLNEHKVIEAEFPCVIKRTDGSNQRIPERKSKTELAFVGKFYAETRTPDYLCKIVDGLSASDYRMNVVGGLTRGQFDDDIIKKYFTNQHPIIHCVGFVHPTKADAYMSNADILVHVGNTQTNIMPSKILDYISTGKPILNICKTRECPTLPLMEKYPLCLNLFEDDGIDAKTIARVDAFCRENTGKQIPFDTISEIYKQYTPQYVGAIFHKAIMDAINEFKQK